MIEANYTILKDKVLRDAHCVAVIYEGYRKAPEGISIAKFIDTTPEGLAERLRIFALEYRDKFSILLKTHINGTEANANYIKCDFSRGHSLEPVQQAIQSGEIVDRAAIKKEILQELERELEHKRLIRENEILKEENARRDTGKSKLADIAQELIQRFSNVQQPKGQLQGLDPWEMGEALSKKRNQEQQTIQSTSLNGEKPGADANTIAFNRSMSWLVQKYSVNGIIKLVAKLQKDSKAQQFLEQYLNE